MAQESRLIAFEQALKDEGIKGTNLEPVARSIFQQESSSGANVKTSNAGARGPMQVLPATFKAYNPQGNIDNPYDNTVGGLRYIKDLYSKTNDPGLTAVGYYGGPKAIEKAKKGIAVSDPRNPNAPNTLQYMEQVMGRTKGAPARQQQRPAVPKTIREAAPELGPNYQAALALMAKADDLSEAREKVAEADELAADADFSQARQMLAQIQPISGFAAQEPRRMADGGLASAANIQTPTLTAKDRERQATLNRQIKEYEEQAKAYNAALEKYNAEVYNPYKAKVDEFNRAAEEYNRSIANFQPSRFKRNPPAFTLTAPTAPDPFNMTAPTVPTTQEEINRFIAEAQARARQNAVGREVALQALQDPRRFNLGSFGLGDISGLAGTSTQLFAEGGEAKKESPSMGEKIKGTAKEVLRSMQYAPYDLLGAPVDVINLGLKGVDYVTGSKLATDKPVGGSEYLIQKSRELGIADEPTGSTTETLTRLGTGIVSPTAGPRAMALAAEKVAAKATPKTASRAQLDAMTAPKPSSGKMYPGEIDPAVQKEIDEIVVPTKTEEPSDRLFYGQVEKWTQSLSGKPTAQEVRNRFAKVGRDYEINRLDLALQGKNPTDKVDAKELMEALKATSPSRYRTEIIEPKEGQFYQSMDSPRPSMPLGTINLLEDLGPQGSLDASVYKQFESINSFLRNPGTYNIPNEKQIKQVEVLLRGPLVNSPELAASFSRDKDKVLKLSEEAKALYDDISLPSFPSLYFPKYGIDNVQDSIKALNAEAKRRGISNPNALPKDVQDQVFAQVKKDNESKLFNEAAKKYNINLDEYVNAADNPGLTPEARYKAGVKKAFEDNLKPRLETISAEQRAITQPYSNVVRTAIEQLRPYEGQHRGIAKNNPISFSRFMDVELPMVQDGKAKDVKGIFITELQSDRLDDVRKFGPKGGSSSKDMEEFQALDQQIDALVKEKNKLMENRYFKQLSEKEKSRFFELETEEQKLSQRMETLRSRSTNRPEGTTYTVPEPFPGMEKMPQVTQQLMIKNAVAAAIKRNDQFVLFPGADSAQPQLYEKLPYNVKTVVKDLGKGFEIKKVPMESENGEVIERLGIFWNEDAAKRIGQEGVRFAKGGAVDKNDLPDQKYI